MPIWEIGRLLRKCGGWYQGGGHRPRGPLDRWTSPVPVPARVVCRYGGIPAIPSTVYDTCRRRSAKGLFLRTGCAASELPPPYLLQTIPARRIAGGSPAIGTLEDPASVRALQACGLEACTSGTAQRKPGQGGRDPVTRLDDTGVRGAPPLNKAGGLVLDLFFFRASSRIQPRPAIAPTWSHVAHTRAPR